MPSLREAYTGKANRAVAAAPLLVGDVVLGALAVRGPRAIAVDADAVSLLETFAGQAALALDNARLHATAVRRAQQLATLNELARSVTTTLDPTEVARQVLRAAEVIIPGAAGSYGSGRSSRASRRCA